MLLSDAWDWDIDGGSTESGLSTYWRLCLNLLLTEQQGYNCGVLGWVGWAILHMECMAGTGGV